MIVTFIVELKDGSKVDYRFSYKDKDSFHKAYHLLNSINDVVYVSVKCK